VLHEDETTVSGPEPTGQRTKQRGWLPT
jgi:hypothetical protein